MTAELFENFKVPPVHIIIMKTINKGLTTKTIIVIIIIVAIAAIVGYLMWQMNIGGIVGEGIGGPGNYTYFWNCSGGMRCSKSSPGSGCKYTGRRC